MRVTWEMAIEEATRCGFTHAALIPARVIDEYMPNRESERQHIGRDPFAILTGARSVLVAAMAFNWYDAWPSECGEVSAFYFQSQRSHEGIRLLAERLCEMGAEVVADQSLPVKLLGRDAGFGVIGRNSLLANKAWGSCFTMRILVTDILPQPSIEAMPAAACGSCRQCASACPLGALDGMGALDTQKCMRTYMMAGEVVPEGMRDAMGQRLLGCEECQRSCPRNAGRPMATPHIAGTFALDKLLAGERVHLDAIAREIGWNEARLQRMQAQAAIIAGNSGNAQYLPALWKLAAHQRPAIAEHAQWAVEKITKERSTC